MGTYLKSLNVVRFENDKKKIIVTCTYDLYANMTIDETKMPVSPVDGNIILDFSIVEDTSINKANIIRHVIPYPPFTLLQDWDSYGHHLTVVRLVNPTSVRDEETMETDDATPVVA